MTKIVSSEKSEINEVIFYGGMKEQEGNYLKIRRFNIKYCKVIHNICIENTDNILILKYIYLCVFLHK